MKFELFRHQVSRVLFRMVCPKHVVDAVSHAKDPEELAVFLLSEFSEGSKTLVQMLIEVACGEYDDN